MLLALPCMAEENLFDKLQPLMDAAAAEHLAKAAQDPMYVGVRPMGAEMSPDGSAVVVLGDLYRAKAQLDTLSPEAYGEVEWLDQRVVVQLQADDSESGWKVISFQMDAELLMENAAQAYFEETMRVFTSERLGFQVQYPALFEALEETEQGVHAQKGDTAFLAERVSNQEGQTLAVLVAREQQLAPEIKAAVNEASGVARLTRTEQGVTTTDVYAVSEAWIYHVQLRWTDAQNADFARYSDYVMNSLSVDELGIG